jgi:hypothetical protein
MSFSGLGTLGLRGPCADEGDSELLNLAVLGSEGMPVPATYKASKRWLWFWLLSGSPSCNDVLLYTWQAYSPVLIISLLDHQNPFWGSDFINLTPTFEASASMFHWVRFLSKHRSWKETLFQEVTCHLLPLTFCRIPFSLLPAVSHEH